MTVMTTCEACRRDTCDTSTPFCSFLSMRAHMKKKLQKARTRHMRHGVGCITPLEHTKANFMKARQSYESARVPEITAIVQQGRFIQMVTCLVKLGERAALAAERAALEAARESARKKSKRGPKKRRARRA